MADSDFGHHSCLHHNLKENTTTMQDYILMGAHLQKGGGGPAKGPFRSPKPIQTMDAPLKGSMY